MPGRESARRSRRRVRQRRRGAISTIAVVVGLVVTVIAVGAVIALLSGRSPGDASADPLDPVQVQRGEIVYQASCASCHGDRGQGGPDWQVPNPDGTLNPPPHNGTGHTWHHADPALYSIIRDGGQIYASAGFVPQMPAFGGLLEPGQIQDVIAYLKSLWAPDQRAYQAQVTHSGH